MSFFKRFLTPITVPTDSRSSCEKREDNTESQCLPYSRCAHPVPPENETAAEKEKEPELSNIVSVSSFGASDTPDPPTGPFGNETVLFPQTGESKQSDTDETAGTQAVSDGKVTEESAGEAAQAERADTDNSVPSDAGHSYEASVCMPAAFTDHAYCAVPQAKEVFVPEPVSTGKEITVESFFAGKGVVIESYNGKEAVAPVESLAYSIAIDYPYNKHFIRFLRDTITKKMFDFKYHLNSLTLPERNAAFHLADMLCRNKLITNYEKLGSTIKGTLSSAPRFINFINGDFMELYAKSVAVGIVSEAASKLDCDFEFYQNMIIAKGAQRHELDIVFRVGEHVFWGEIKSGDFNPDDYRKIGLFLGMVPDRLILLAANEPNDVVTSVSYFNECFCANVGSFKSSLIRMIAKAFGKEEIGS